MVLLACLIIAAIFGVIMLCAGSIAFVTAFVTAFGDVIVAGLIIGLIIKHFVKKKKN